jgi:Na+-driven multidrug efflux pump
MGCYVMIKDLTESLWMFRFSVCHSRLGPNELATVGQGIQIMGVTTTVLILSSTAAQTTLSAPLFTLKSNNTTTSKSKSKSKSPSPSSSTSQSKSHSHSHSGKKEIGIIAQRGFILAHLCVLPMLVVWWFIKPIMIALGQPESLAEGLQGFLRWMMLYVPGYGESHEYNLGLSEVSLCGC